MQISLNNGTFEGILCVKFIFNLLSVESEQAQQ